MKNILQIICLAIVFGSSASPSYAGRVWGNDGLTLGYRSYLTEYYMGYPPLHSLPWQDNSILFIHSLVRPNGDDALVAQVFYRDGTIEQDPVTIDSDGGAVEQVFPDREGGLFILWQKRDNFARNYYIQHLDDNLNPLMDEPGISFIRSDSGEYCRFAEDYLLTDEDGIILFYHEVLVGRVATPDYALKLNRNGDIAEGWGDAGRELNPDRVKSVSFSGSPDHGMWIRLSYFHLEDGFPDSADFRMNKMLPNGDWAFEEPIDINFRNRPAPIWLLAMHYTDNAGGVIVVMDESVWTEDLGYDSLYIQHFDSEGVPAWDDGYLFFSDDYSRPIPDNTGERFYQIVSGEGNTRSIQLYAITEDGYEPIWDVPTEIEGLNNRNSDWLLLADNSFLFAGRTWEVVNEYGVTNAITYRISDEGELLWGEEGLQLYEEDLYESWDWVYDVQKLIETRDGTLYQLADAHNHFTIHSISAEGEFNWDNRCVRPFPHGIDMIFTLQMLENQTVRPIYRDYHQLSYQLVSSDGNLLRDSSGIPFAVTDCTDYWLYPYSALSGRNFGILSKEINPEGGLYHFLTVLNGDNEIVTEDRFDLAEQLQGDEYPKFIGDGQGGFILRYRPRENQRYIPYEMLFINSDGEIDGDPIRPFPDESWRPTLLPDSIGNCWVYGWDRADDVMRIQKVLPDKSLNWDRVVPAVNLSGFANGRGYYGAGSDYTFILSGEEDLFLQRTVTDGTDELRDSMMYSYVRYDGEADILWDEAVDLFDPAPYWSERNEEFWNDEFHATRMDGGLWVAILCRSNDFDAPPGSSRLYLQLLSEDGERMMGDTGAEIPSPHKWDDVKLISDSEDGVWLVWMYENGDNYNSRALHLDRNGELIDELSGWEGTEAVTSPNMRMEGVALYDDNTIALAIGDNASRRIQRLDDEPQSVTGSENYIPIELSVDAPYPSPFNSTVTIAYSLNKTARINFRLFDITGREVRELYNGFQFAGRHRISFNAVALPSGVYFARLSSGNVSERVKLICVK